MKGDVSCNVFPQIYRKNLSFTTTVMYWKFFLFPKCHRNLVVWNQGNEQQNIAAGKITGQSSADDKTGTQQKTRRVCISDRNTYANHTVSGMAATVSE